MTYRAKLLGLVAGVCLLPVILPAFVFYLRGLNSQESGRILERRFVQMVHWSEDTLPKAWSAGTPVEAFDSLPKGERVIVLDTAGTVLFATIAGFNAGEKPPPDRLLQSLTDTPGFRSMTIPVVVDGSPVGTLVHQVPNRRGKAAQIALKLERPVVYISFVVLAATILIVIVTGSLRRGIERLDRAAARVANGDLEFELKSKGADELATLTRSFESMRKALKEERAMRSRFLMAVSHDLKTPLTSIKGYLEAIHDGVAREPEMLERHLGIISDKSTLLESRINELIDYVKMSTGEWQLRHRPVRIHGFLTELGKVFAADAQVFHRSFSCSVELPEELELAGDEGLITRALDNLFHNALRYTREGDAIFLEASQDGDEVVIAFRDSGPGVPEEELERIFEPFYRGSSSRREAGTGLGLSTARSIFAAHGWSIVARSPGGKGFTLIIRARNPIT